MEEENRKRPIQHGVCCKRAWKGYFTWRTLCCLRKGSLHFIQNIFILNKKVPWCNSIVIYRFRTLQFSPHQSIICYHNVTGVREWIYFLFVSVYLYINADWFLFSESHRQQFKSSNNCQNQSTGRKHNFFRFFWPEHQREYWFYWSNNIRKPSIRLICISVVIFYLENNQ